MQKIEKNIPFYLFSSCFTTKGATRSILIDSERKIFEFIPNALEHILKVHQGKTFNELISYDNVNLNVLEEYFNFLINNEFIYFSNDSFWKKNPNYEFENKLLKDIIIDYSIIIKNYFDEIIFQISDLFCEGLLIIFDNNEDEKEVLYVLDKIKHSTIEHLEIYINYSETLNSVYYDWFLKFPFLQLIVFNNCNSEDFKVIDESTNKYV